MTDTVTSVAATGTPDEVRAELDAWLSENWDPDLTVEEWWARLAGARWTSPALPPEAGGRGYGRDLAAAVSTGLAEANVVGPPMGLGLMLAAPTIGVHGTPEQIDRWVPPILEGTDAWCQLFSEPGAGSDLAGLQCKAIRDGDEWIITGQKVWTSGGHTAQKGMLIARTDPEAPKHQGITYFGIDMDQPGIEVRPLREMTGQALFNEVFLDEARVPHDAVIGGLGVGWAVANTTLAFERASLGGGGKQPVSVPPGPTAGRLQARAGDYTERVNRGPDGEGGRGMGTSAMIDLARAVGNADDPIVRQEIVQLHILGEVNRLNMQRAKAGGSRTGAEGNLAKLAMSELVRRSRDVGNLIIGADGMLAPANCTTGGVVQEVTVFSPAPAIYGGTDQVQRNIIGERVLGLPKEPGPDKGTPFRDLLQN
ncbi:MAG: acyl-CoA dehydrogenase family protein [Acidimicrobiales bacterium]|jgi:alkylation response protein AidB-like acyl-CoA dehydrogenase|nr:acyl-CoA dehydrogenase [Actinomycetes bacterium]MDG1988665.1 acyl-CoA dehydrogenase family protein [Acidimicrobiales bacterium]MDP6160409.1 acyl-CoA dehydrogenase family protein [Acidimicrobiales bacterium]MDP6910744.1 acyl-CoA dehydrogenase family protein [Acidimicrobiales bacterium]HJM72325.1 acyl-CoA dehydrogenase family protein [Acidimicrobiales bacterium]